MRAKTETRTAIERQFMRLYKKKEYHRISVKELCAETPVARTTFYSYYQNIEDVKTGIEDALIDEILRIMNWWLN